MHHHTKSSEKLQRLREEPQTELTLPNGGPLRTMIKKMNVSGGGNGDGKSRCEYGSRPKTVYYLYGDERRAVRKFIQVNEEFVRRCMQDQYNPIASSLPTEVYQMLKEEFEIMDYNGEI